MNIKEIIQKVKLHKKIIVLAFLAITGIFLIFIQTKNRPTTEIIDKNESPTPTQAFIKLEPPDVFPKPGDNIQIGGTKQAISLFFNTKVKLDTVKIVATPKIEFDVVTNPDHLNRVILRPQTTWESGVEYQIAIQPGIESIDGQSSLQDLPVLIYKVVEVELPSFDRPI